MRQHRKSAERAAPPTSLRASPACCAMLATSATTGVCEAGETGGRMRQASEGEQLVVPSRRRSHRTRSRLKATPARTPPRHHAQLVATKKLHGAYLILPARQAPAAAQREVGCGGELLRAAVQVEVDDAKEAVWKQAKQVGRQQAAGNRAPHKGKTCSAVKHASWRCGRYSCADLAPLETQLAANDAPKPPLPAFHCTGLPRRIAAAVMDRE